MDKCSVRCSLKERSEAQSHREMLCWRERAEPRSSRCMRRGTPWRRLCGKKCDTILDETSDNNKLSCRSSCSATYAACDFTNLLPGKELLTWVTTPSKPDLYSCEESYKLCGAQCLKIKAESKIAGDTTRLGCQTACSTKYASCDFRGFFPGREVFSSFGDKVGAVGSFLQDIARSKKDKTQ